MEMPKYQNQPESGSQPAHFLSPQLCCSMFLSSILKTKHSGLCSPFPGRQRAAPRGVSEASEKLEDRKPLQEKREEESPESKTEGTRAISIKSDVCKIQLSPHCILIEYTMCYAPNFDFGRCDKVASEPSNRGYTRGGEFNLDNSDYSEGVMLFMQTAL
ncbi:hypothetical protein EYF80_045155 [Liparis tanakae]|uniref:Uncharacterized protein n=1 Tax=Liparis tanakae TaxID=230148 RepID=A0A4Z2FTU5_9TELE|nr:hypothetical protein EYF80_045155 [Liparis tanakae]